MAGQSVLDIKFQDIAAGDLKNTINRSVEELVKDITKNVQDALGVSGTMSSLGVIPTREGAIGGIRFGVDDKYFDAVSNAVRGRLGKLSEAAGVKHLASVSRNSSMDALVKRSVQIYNDDPNSLSELKALLESAGGRIIQSYPNKGGYTTYYSQFLNRHDVGNPLSTLQMYNSIGAASQDFHNANMLVQQQEAEKAARIAAAQRQIEVQRRRTAIDYNNELANRKLTHANWGAISGEEGYDWSLDDEEAERKAAALAEAQATRKPDVGYLSGDADEKYFESQAERRKRLGIVYEDSKDVAGEQDTKNYFKKSLALLGVISGAVTKILSSVLKIYERDLQTKYGAQSTGVPANLLASLENVLKSMGLSGKEAGAALGMIQSGLGNPYAFNGELISGLAPIYGAAGRSSELSKMTLGMLQGKWNSAGALQSIMEATRAAVDMEGNDWSFALAYNQLRDKVGQPIADFFQAYYNYYNEAGNKDKTFYDFTRLRRAKNVSAGADAGLGWAKLKTLLGTGWENFVRGRTAKSIFGDANYTPETTSELFDAFGVGDDYDAWTAENEIEGLKAIREQLGTNGNLRKYITTGYGTTYGDSKIKGLLDLINNRIAELEGGANDLGFKSETAPVVNPPQPIIPVTGTSTANSVQQGTSGSPAGNVTVYNDNTQNYGEMIGKSINPNLLTSKIYLQVLDKAGNAVGGPQEIVPGQDAFITYKKR